MATNKKSVRKLSTTVKFSARLESTTPRHAQGAAPAPRRQARAFCISCQFGNHCGSCSCCSGHAPQPRFVNGNLEVF